MLSNNINTKQYYSIKDIRKINNDYTISKIEGLILVGLLLVGLIVCLVIRRKK